MAYYIFSDISEFKQSIAGGANMSLEMASIEAKINVAARRHVVPWIGLGLWNELLDTFNGLSVENQSLLPHLQKAVAPLALYEYAKIGGIQLTGTGLQRMETENLKSAYKYQENSYRESHLEDGYEAIEWLLEFLWANQGDYPLWTSPEKDRSRALFLNTATTFRNYYMHSISSYTFNLLRPLIAELETFSILPMLGENFYNDLKAKVLADNFNTEEADLLKIIQRVLVHFSIEEAMRRMWVQLKGGVIVQTEKLEPQGYQREGSPAGQPFATKTEHHHHFGNRHMSFLQKYLTDHIDDFVLYKAYVELSATATEEEADTDCINPDYLNLKYDCGCNHSCSCKSNQSQAVVDL